MNNPLKAILILAICLASTVIWSQDRTATTEAQRAEVKRAVISATASSKPAAATELSAGPAVATSAACCLKQCGEGGTCGHNCTIADSLSQCGAVNFKFECPSGTGMTCLGSDCSCQ